MCVCNGRRDWINLHSIFDTYGNADTINSNKFPDKNILKLEKKNYFEITNCCLTCKIEISDIEIKNIFELRNIYIVILHLKYFMSWIKFDKIFSFIYQKTLNIKKKNY